MRRRLRANKDFYMTLETDSAQPSGGVTPGKTSASPKKPRQTTRKTATRKTASPKQAEKPVEQDAGIAPAKKPRATAQGAAKPAARKTTRASATTDAKKNADTPPPDKPAAKTADKPDPSGADTPKTESPAKTASPKPAAGKAKSASRRSAKVKNAPLPSASAKDGGKDDKKETATTVAESAPAAPEAEKPAPRSAPRQTGRQSAPKPAAEPAAIQNTPRETAPQEHPAAAEPEAAPLSAAPAEAQNQTVPQEGNAKPSSRRSRRGGRRRNKSRSGASAAASAETAMPHAVAEKDAPASQESETREAPQAEPDPKAGQKQKKTDKATPKTAAKTEVKEPARAAAKTAGGKRKMFISVLSGELVEVVLAEEGAVAEYYVEMQHQAKVKGNIYKGVISNIDANLQAAFVSYAGGVKNGFLQVDEVHPEYYVAHHDPIKGRKYPPIQKVLKPGQEILVQVVKEPAGTKGAFLTSYLSLPGRFIVLTPGREQIGVSRKVDSDEERTRLRGLLEGIKPGPGLGVIVRTVSTGASKTSLQRDLQFLKRLWKEVRAKGQTAPAPGLIYEELDLSTRAVRDYLTDDVQEVWVDDAETARQVNELTTLLFPKKLNLVQVHADGAQPLFERFSLQKQLDQIHSREVSLPSGGHLVIDNTEALTAIDINSGRTSGKSTFEDMAFRTNLEAARAIPLQLRLRDIGGQVVADFIEMRDRDHWREVEKAVRNGMKGDRARYDVGKIGPFGMLEIVRQRLGSSAISISTEPCPCCKGTGIRRNMEWRAMQALRDIGKLMRQAAANNQTSATYQAESELAFYLLNAKRSILQHLEQDSGVTLVVGMHTE